MRKRALLALACAAATVLVVAATPTAVAASPAAAPAFDARAYLKEHGYLPLRGPAVLAAAKEHAAAVAAANAAAAPAAKPAPVVPFTPVVGPSWQGTNTNTLTPPDGNGAIGPNSYIETVNTRLAIYSRTGTQIANSAFSTLTGNSSGSDPMVLWDPDTQRFYYNIWNTSNARMDWGFSKDSNPTSIPGSFCRYETNFGYATTTFPDYPKLGQTKDFLLIGVNFYPTSTASQSTSSDVLWVAKPQGQGAITTCPAAGSAGKITGLLNNDGTQAFTPVPAIQTDPSSTSYVLGMSDIECPPNCGSGTKLTVFTVTNNAGVPAISAPNSITVGTYSVPPAAPQSGTTRTIDTLDGRITHAVSGFDPNIGATAVWVSHTVAGGAGSQINWYEVNTSTGALAQSGSVSSASLYVFNAGISNDRTCTATTCAHGSAMVLGFTTSGTSAFPAVQVVSKIGSAATSGFVLIKQSTTSDKNFSCSPCRWGDYGGATPDPAASLTGSTGSVWLTNQWTTGGSLSGAGDRTWNWQTTP